jgi:phage shock protein E
MFPRNRMAQLVMGVVAITLLAAGVFLMLTRGEDKAPENVESEANVEPQLITADEYNASMIDQEHLLVDVRTPEEYAAGHIPGAVNIPLQSLSERMDEISGDQPVVLYCQSGNRSAQAVELLDAAGYTNLYDLGGIRDWQAEGYPVE